MNRFPVQLLILFGMLFFGVSAWWTVDSRRFMAASVKVPGQVVDFNVDSVYRPIFEYEYPAGMRHRIQSSSGSNPPGYAVGERVHVWVKPSNPAYGRVDAFTEFRLGPLLFGGMGVLILSIGMGWPYGSPVGSA